MRIVLLSHFLQILIMEEKIKPQITLSKQWILRLNKSQIGHFVAFERFDFYDKIIGVSIVLFSGITTGLLLFDFNNLDKGSVNILILVFSLLTSIASSLHAFLGLRRKADLHKSKASKYGALKRNIEVFLVHENQDFDTFLKSIETQWSIIADDSPVTPRKIRDMSKSIIQNDISDQQELMK